MDNIQTLMANLTDEQVTAYQAATYPPSVRDWAKQEQEARVARRQLAQDAIANQIREEQSKIEFGTKVAEIANLPQPPQGVHNVYLSWQEVEVEDKAHPEEVQVPKLGENSLPIMTSKGVQVMVKETRYPKVKSHVWVVETNKGFQVGKSSDKEPKKPELKKESNVVSAMTNPPKTVVAGMGWSEAIDYINASPELLALARQDKLGKNADGTCYIIKTKASQKKDLEAAGFNCYQIEP